MPLYDADGKVYEDAFDFHNNQPSTPDSPLRVTVHPRQEEITPGSNNVQGDRDPTDYTNRYNTPLSLDEQKTYDQKYSENDKYDYDMQGFHKDHPDYDPTVGGHFPDTYKKPNHPTFSTESRYSNNVHRGGSWEKKQDGSYNFVAGDQNLRTHGIDSLKDYFNRIEPDNKLDIPSDAAQAQSARESAAQRMQQANKPAEGRQTSEFSDQLGSLLLPGYGAIQSLQQGDYGEAVLQGLGIAAPVTRFMSPEARSMLMKGMAGVIGGTFALTPKATGGDESRFPFVDNPKEREGYEKQLNDISVFRTKANGQARVDLQGKPIVDLQATNQAKQKFIEDTTNKYTNQRREDMLHERLIQEADKARVGEEAAKQAALDRFMEANKDTIDKFKPEEKEHFDSLVHPSDINETLKGKAAYLTLLANQKEAARKIKEQGEKAFAQREPEVANAMRAIAIALGVIIPWGVATGRAQRVDSIASKVEKKITEMRDMAKAAGRPLTLEERKVEESWFNMQKNALEAYNNLHSISKLELLGSSVFPMTANQIIPNLIDSRVLSDNPDNPNYKKAVEGLHPWTEEFWHQAIPNLMEGGMSSIGGAVLGKGTKDFEKAKLRSLGAQETIKDEKAIITSMENNATKPKRAPRKNVQKHVDDTYKEMKEEQAQKNSKEVVRSPVIDTPKSTVKLEEVPTAMSSEGHHIFDIKNTEGEIQATVNLSITNEGKHIIVNNIAQPHWMETKEASNRLGTKDMTNIKKQLLERFPDAERIAGFRTTGAKKGSAKFTNIKVK